MSEKPQATIMKVFNPIKEKGQEFPPIQLPFNIVMTGKTASLTLANTPVKMN